MLFALGVDLALRFAQQAQVVFRVLLKILCGHAVTGQLRVARKLVVFVDDLLRCAAHFALGARAVEHAVDDVATTPAIVRAAVARVL